MSIKDKVKQWFIGPVHKEESLIPIENKEQFSAVLTSGTPIIFKKTIGYGLIMFEEKNQLGVVQVKDVFNTSEELRHYLTQSDFHSFFEERVREGISFYT
ncbi:hypothetical protein [Bacillus sp. NEB1478]|uniref:hypothetical protein n=1 Tax=Bacillus sp. NEB1478 TaxID=3073816 RepID=UPI002873E8EF|nr:hypothetical protein [Bacillus sp. NEB1478]WNB92798.1 hypothetical protein RGB74_03760 [Bacillus sp. NEB1478]